jgi:hypothetical protein
MLCIVRSTRGRRTRRFIAAASPRIYENNWGTIYLVSRVRVFFNSKELLWGTIYLVSRVRVNFNSKDRSCGYFAYLSVFVHP